MRVKRRVTAPARAVPERCGNETAGGLDFRSGVAATNVARVPLDICDRGVNRALVALDDRVRRLNVRRGPTRGSPTWVRTA